MDFFLQHKKTFGSLGIILILAPLLSGIRPHEAEAVVIVDSPAADEQMDTSIVIDWLDLAVVKLMQYYDFLRDFILNPLAWMMAKALIHQITLSIVQWINNGFQGQPGFITDPGRFLKNAANTATGIFLENYVSADVYDLLCEPWRLPTLSVIMQIHTTTVAPVCTLDTLLNNASNMAKFMGKFRQGGWKGFFSLTKNRNNNIYGHFIAMNDALETSKAAAVSNARDESQMNSGFLSMKTCVGGFTASGICKEWSVDSPGKWVESQLEWTTSSEIRQLELADEVDEILGALAGYMVKTAYKGLLAPSTPGTPTPLPPGVPGATGSIIDNSITSEDTYLDLKQDAIPFYNQAVSLYDSAISCYTTYVSDWNNCTSTRSSVSISDITGTISGLTGLKNTIINTTIPAIQSDVGDALANLTKLDDLKTRTTAATTAQELQDILAEYQTLLPSLHDAADIGNAQSEYNKAQALTVAPRPGASTTANAYWQVNNCAALPAACIIPPIPP